MDPVVMKAAPFIVRERGVGYGSGADSLQEAIELAREMRRQRDHAGLVTNQLDVYQLVDDEDALHYDDNSGEYYDAHGNQVSERGVLPADDDDAWEDEADRVYYDEDTGEEVDTETGERW